MNTSNPYFPWEPTTAPSTPISEPEQPPWKTPLTTGTGTYNWPSPPVHPAELEKFEEFVIWACGFTDPEHPPSQKKWEEFQQKVMELAADFVEYKRQKRDASNFTSKPFTTSSVQVDNSKITQEQIDRLLSGQSGSVTTL